MSKATSSTLPRHRIDILMSPAGRFLECRDCQISFSFPDGAQFGTIAKQALADNCRKSPFHSLTGIF